LSAAKVPLVHEVAVSPVFVELNPLEDDVVDLKIV